jgi:hypothetical protein
MDIKASEARTTSKNRNLITLKPTPSSPKDRSAVIVTAASQGEMDAAIAHKLTRPEVGSAAVIEAWSKGGHDVNALVAELGAQVDAVNRGEMKRAEGMLLAQAHTLDAIFVNLMRRATNQTALHLWEAYMRMGMKAQSQCRATLQALADLKNPRPFAFVKQANIAHGHQQVNNGQASLTSTPAYAPAGKNESEQTKLLEDFRDGRTFLDTGATPAAARGDSALEAVEPVHGATQPRRKAAGRS